MILYRGSCLDCVPPHAVIMTLSSMYNKAMGRAVAREFTAKLAMDPPSSELQRCAVAKAVYGMRQHVPMAFVQLPFAMQADYVSRSAHMSRLLEGADAEVVAPEEEDAVMDESAVTRVNVASAASALEMDPLPAHASLADHTQEYEVVGASSSDEPEKVLLETVKGEWGTVRLFKTRTSFQEKESESNVPIDIHLEPRSHTAYVLWVIRCVTNETVRLLHAGDIDKEEALTKFVSEEIGDHPFIVAVRGSTPELVVMYRKAHCDKNRDKQFKDAELQPAFGFKRGGHPGKKIVGTIELLVRDSMCFLSNLVLEETTPESENAAEPHSYEHLESTVAHWGTKRFEQFICDVAIKKANKLQLTQFESSGLQ